VASRSIKYFTNLISADDVLLFRVKAGSKQKDRGGWEIDTRLVASSKERKPTGSNGNVHVTDEVMTTCRGMKVGSQEKN